MCLALGFQLFLEISSRGRITYGNSSVDPVNILDTNINYLKMKVSLKASLVSVPNALFAKNSKIPTLERTVTIPVFTFCLFFVLLLD